MYDTDIPGYLVDSHQHFWRLSRNDYRWMTPDMKDLYRDYLPKDLLETLNTHHIKKTVLIQAADSDEETDFLLSLSANHEFISGVVGWVDMASSDSRDRLIELSKHSKLRGIRPMIQDISDKDWMLRDSLIPCFNTLIELNLTFDALVLPIHLENLMSLLQRFPDLRVVIDHAAKPDIASGHIEVWKQHMSTIAENTNAYCKLSGLLNEAGGNASISDLKPIVQHLIDTFTPSRLMWGSDWPVVNMVSDYKHWYQLAMELTKELSTFDKQQLFGGTAIKFYNLEVGI